MSNKKEPTSVAKEIPVDVVNCFRQVMEAFNETQITKREISKIKAQQAVLIKEIEEKYSFYRELFDNVFAERRITIEKIFEIIDKGIQDDNDNLVLNGLKGLSEIVKTSPIASALELKNSYQQKGYLDFSQTDDE